MPTRSKRAPRPRTRLSAGDRRELIEQAATELFATRGFRGASVEEISRRAGVTPPVVYDHFSSKRELYQHLVDHHYGQLRSVWFDYASSEDPVGDRLPHAVDEWFGYLEEHPFVAGLLFREPVDDESAGVRHRSIRRKSREAMVALLASEAAQAGVDVGDPDLAWETLRAVLQGLALWWSEHPDVERERIVTAAMNALWIGYERVLNGEVWAPARGG